MRIGFFTDAYFPINFGTEIAIETFRKKLEELGNEVFIFAPKFPGFKDESEKVFRFPSLKVMSEPESRLFGFCPKTVSFIASLKLDICHSHTFFSAGWLAKLVSQRLKIPVIHQYHIFYPAYIKSRFSRVPAFFLSRLAEKYTRFFLNLHNAVIAPSLKIKKILEEYGVNRPIYVLPTGLDLLKFKSIKKDLSWGEKYGIKPEDKVLIYVGRQTPEKNILFLIKAFALISAQEPKAKLMLVGEGPLKSEIEKLAKKEGFENRLVFTGRISQEQTLQAYLASQVFLFASKTDTQGLVMLEAAALGLPIVALKDEAYEGILKNEENGYIIFEEDPRVFSEAVLKILRNPGIFYRFSENSKKFAEFFSDLKQAEKLLAIYKELLNK